MSALTLARAIRTTCPYCHAGPFVDCISRTGRALWPPHRTRINAAAALAEPATDPPQTAAAIEASRRTDKRGEMLYRQDARP